MDGCIDTRCVQKTSAASVELGIRYVASETLLAPFSRTNGGVSWQHFCLFLSAS